MNIIPKALKWILAPLMILVGTHLVAAELDQTALIYKFNEAFNQIKTMKADFTQLTSDNTKLTGQFYMKRPKKMRINYNRPSKDFIVSDGTFVFYWDDALSQQSQTTVGSTIIGFLMKENFLNSEEIKILSLSESDKAYELIFTDSESVGEGKIELYFNKNRDDLFQWRIRDFEGNWTLVTLSDIQKNMPLKNDLFYFRKPLSK